MEIKSHKDLKVWQESMDLVITIYKITQNFPATEQYGIAGQMKRAVISIPSNIAEGAGRKGEKELIRFLFIALGSLSELETQMELSRRLGYVSDIDFKNVEPKIYYIRKMLSGLIKSLKNHNR